MRPRSCIGLFAIGLASCVPRHEPQQPTTNQSSPVLPAPSAPPPVSNSPAATPTAKMPVTDPKSTQAAVNLVHSFVELLNQHEFEEAYMLLGAGAQPRTKFDKVFTRYSDLEVTVSAPGDQEGAAGSIYLSVPLTVSGIADGKHTSRSATAILRRVNDVPGSTEAQRHWHIERIDWRAGG